MLAARVQHNSESLESEHAVLESAANLASELGFDYCTYIFKMPLPISRPTLLKFVGRNSIETTKRGTIGDTDPRIVQGLMDMRPFQWQTKSLKSGCPFSENVRYDGFTHGWAHSARTGNGGIGTLFLGWNGEQASVEKCATVNTRSVSSIAQNVHGGMTEALIRKHIPEAASHISNREREVLRWAAEGKTSQEISKIIDVSYATVNFHLKNAIRKLGATNKVQGVAKAIALGLLI